MKPTQILLLFGVLWLTTFHTYAQQRGQEVKIIGQMKNVMWKGELFGNILLDTIADKTHLYGMGPVEYLRGEVLIMDGRCYQSVVVSDTSMRVFETYSIKSPFFGYANIAKWSDHALPDSVLSMQDLENYLVAVTINTQRPLFFKLSGVVEQATIHIVNLPKGSKVKSPDEAHKGQVNYSLTHESSDILGFFSTQHKAIFTHHDTFLHMHLMTADRKKMGHLDNVVFKKGTMRLFLPTE